MTDFFPRQTIQWKAIEDTTLARRVSTSLPEMALLAGVVMRLYRTYVMSHGSPDSWLWVVGTFLIGLVFLLAVLTAHLSNFTVRHWWWRAPAFALMEAGTEIVMSLALTALGWETVGSAAAGLEDWFPSAVRILVTRLLIIMGFTVLLAGVVSVIRRLLLAREHRYHTAVRVSRELSAHPEPPSGTP